MKQVRVFEAALLGEGETKTFVVEQDGRRQEAFVLRRNGDLLAFLNECPHWYIELDLGDGHFFDPALDRIYCKNHGALFILPSGVCETGPCLGKRLSSLPLRLDGLDVLVGP